MCFGVKHICIIRDILPSVATTSIGDDEDGYDSTKDGVANCVIYGNRDLTLN